MSENKLAHPREEILERFAIGRLEEPELGEFEEHLLFCGHCQERLDDATEYVSLMREATAIVAAEVPREAAWRQWLRTGWSIPMPAMAAAMAIFIAVVAWQPWQTPAPGEWRRVELATLRGGAIGGTALEGFALELQLDAAGLSATSATAQIVNATGKIIAEMPVPLIQGKAELRHEAGLVAGQYWVRLKLKQGGETLREYSLTVERRR